MDSPLLLAFVFLLAFDLRHWFHVILWHMGLVVALRSMGFFGIGTTHSGFSHIDHLRYYYATFSCSICSVFSSKHRSCFRCPMSQTLQSTFSCLRRSMLHRSLHQWQVQPFFQEETADQACRACLGQRVSREPIPPPR